LFDKEKLIITPTQAKKNLQIIPGIGPSLSQDLFDLGYRNSVDLKDEIAELMYQKLIDLRGKSIDRCVLYVFRCAVYYASHSVHEPELLKWWNWKNKQSTHNEN